MEGTQTGTLRVINLGVSLFYEALVEQGAEAIQLDWTPPAPRNEEIDALLDGFL